MAGGKENKRGWKGDIGQKDFLFYLFICSSYWQVCFNRTWGWFSFFVLLLSSPQLRYIWEAAKTEKGASYFLFQERTWRALKGANDLPKIMGRCSRSFSRGNSEDAFWSAVSGSSMCCISLQQVHLACLMASYCLKCLHESTALWVLENSMVHRRYLAYALEIIHRLSDLTPEQYLSAVMWLTRIAAEQPRTGQFVKIMMSNILVSNYFEVQWNPQFTIHSFAAGGAAVTPHCIG